MLTRRMVDSILPRRVWPIGLIVTCLGLEAAGLRIGIDDLDEGYFLQQATRVADGQVPFRDFETLYAPGLAYLHAVLGPSLLEMRILALGARAGIALLVFVLARPVVRHSLVAALPGMVLLLGFDDAPVRWEPHPGWLSTLFALLAVWCCSRYLVSRRWLIAAGVAAAAAYAFKQNTGALILIALLIWNRHAVRVPLVTFVVTTLSWVIPLAYANRENLAALAPLVGGVNEAGIASAPDLTNVIPIGCLAGGVWLIRRDSNPLFRWYLLAGAALYLTELPRMDTLHLAWSAPLLLVLGAVVLSRLPRPLVVGTTVVVAALLMPNVSSRVAYLQLPRAPIDGVEAPTRTASELEYTVEEIQRSTGPGEPIFVYPSSPLLYVLADRPNPTRFDHLNPGAANPTQIQNVIAALHASHVRLVVISDYWLNGWGPPGPNAALDEWINQHYVNVARHGPYRVLQPTV